MNLEEYLDEEFRLMKVTPSIHHIKMWGDSYFNVVTVAVPDQLKYNDVLEQLGIIVGDCCEAGRKDYGRFIVDAYNRLGWGVALCHHTDQFSRKLGRVIAKGRLFKVLRAEGCKP